METKDPKQPKRNGSAPSQPTKPEPAKPVTGHAARILASAPEEQIAAALRAKKYERAADLIERHGERLLAEGAEATLLTWFDEVPDALVRKAPRLAVLHAWLLVYVERYQTAASRLSEAERALRALEVAGAHGWPEDDADVVALEPFADLKRGIRAVRAHLAWIEGDLSELPDSVEGMMLPASADHPVWRARALVTLGRCHHLAGSLDDARDALDAALACAHASGQRRAAIIAHQARVVLGRVHEAAGRLDAASALYDEVVAAADDTVEHADVVAAARIGRGRVALTRLDLEGSRPALTAGLDRLESTASQAVGLDGLIALAWLEQASGDAAAARDALDRAERFVKATGRRWPLEIVSAQRARLAVARGDVPAARRWAQQFALRGAARLGPVRELQLVTHGLCLLAGGDAEAAAAPLAEARAAADAGGRPLIAVEAAIAQARAWSALGDAKAADNALSDALALAAPAQVVAPFVIEGPLPAALRDALTTGRGREAGKEELVDAILAATAPAAGDGDKKTPARAKAGARTKAAPIATSKPVDAQIPTEEPPAAGAASPSDAVDSRDADAGPKEELKGGSAVEAPAR